MTAAVMHAISAALRQRSPDFDDPIFSQVARVEKIGPAHRHDVHDILNAKLIAQNFHYGLCATKRQALIGRVRALFVSEPQDHQDKRGIVQQLLDLGLTQCVLDKGNVLR
jgi:hypothetical protein